MTAHPDVSRYHAGDMTPAEPSGSVQWTPAHNSAAADYSSLDKDAADLGAQLDFFGESPCLQNCCRCVNLQSPQSTCLSSQDQPASRWCLTHTLADVVT